MKKIIGLMCLLMTLAGSAFAKNAEKKGIGFYGNLNIGYANVVYHKSIFTETLSEFEVAPVFGVTGLVPVPHFAIEGFCNMDFGGKKWGGYNLQSIFIVPGTRAVWAPPISFFSGKTGTWQDQLIPFVGAGFSVPIGFYKVEYDTYTYTSRGTQKSTASNEETEVYFDVELQFGCRWAFTDKLAVLAEDNICFGGIFKHSFTAGVLYTFK
ncbi:hypothetical protein [Treponema sp. C6A8]|uniref:hypothetical protein n=1 Tax=Treponema sp. C6A8 TaxID=1410609 RepID=UPI000481DC4A|nr:hypothetical protein [Treponema sp. C6A8]